jgi:hypothetical protein
MARAQFVVTLLTGCVLLAAVNNSAWADRKLPVPTPLKGATNANQASLNWSNIAGETGFLIERRLFNSGNFAEVGKTVADVTSYKDILTTTDEYEYRVRAYRATGSNISYSNYTNVVDLAPANAVDSSTNSTTSNTTASSTTTTTTTTVGDSTTPCP